VPNLQKNLCGFAAIVLELSCSGSTFEGCNTGFYELNSSSCKGLTTVQKVGRRLLEGLDERTFFSSTFYNLMGCASCPALAAVAFPKSKSLKGFYFNSVLLSCLTHFPVRFLHILYHILKCMKL
jgi:hypothetical protein